MKKLLPLAILLLFANHSQAQSRQITVDELTINVRTLGLDNRQAGQPVVVFESGHGTPMGNWDRVVEGVATLAPVVTYDRPGIGESEATEEMPTLEHVADRLVAILRTLDLEPPYILVGHSLGGVYVRGFAVYYPEMLAGLVIIDPGDFTENYQNIRDHYEVLDWEDDQVDSLIQHFVDIRVARNNQSPPAIQREGQVLEDLRTTGFREIAESPLPNIPVHILVGGRFDMPEQFRSTVYDDEALFRSKIQHRVARWTDVVQSVDKGRLFYSAEAGHFIQWDDPELVLASIKLILHDVGMEE